MQTRLAALHGTYDDSHVFRRQVCIVYTIAQLGTTITSDVYNIQSWPSLTSGDKRGVRANLTMTTYWRTYRLSALGPLEAPHGAHGLFQR